MKSIYSKFLSIFVFFIAGHAMALPSPTSLVEACDLIKGTPAALTFNTECKELSVNGADFNLNAIGACSRLRDNNMGNLVIFPCLVAIRDRVYTDDQVTACDELADEASTLSCFHSTGTPRVSNATSAQISVMELSQTVNYSLSAVNNYQMKSAQDALTALLNKLNYASQVICK